ncbi:MAG: hypothetical protein FWE15_20065 [Actinomycetia bacterium]|nr:hypothetical protein [Actinomycetes bacterium]
MNGSAVRHLVTGRVGVVFGETRRRVFVATSPGCSEVWYKASVTEI